MPSLFTFCIPLVCEVHFSVDIKAATLEEALVEASRQPRSLDEVVRTGQLIDDSTRLDLAGLTADNYLPGQPTKRGLADLAAPYFELL